MYGRQCHQCGKICSCQQNNCGSRDSSLKRKSVASSKQGYGHSSASSKSCIRSSRQSESGAMGKSNNVVQGLSSRKSVLCPSNVNVGPQERSSASRKSMPTKPFNPYCGDNPRIFTAPPVIVPQKSSSKSVTKAVRDYDHTSSVRNFVAVPYGVELYDENPFDDIRISRADFETLVSKAWALTSDTVKDGRGSGGGRKCTELNQPKFNTLKKSVRDIQEAIAKLRLIPNDVQKNVKNDPVYQKKIQETVTKKLNVPPTAQIYKDLIQVDPPEAERVRSTEEILKQIRSAQLPPKTKDPEPNILDFNHPTFSRIRPSLPDPPPKSQEGLSLDVEEEFRLIASEHNFTEKGSNASLFNQPVSKTKVLDK